MKQGQIVKVGSKGKLPGRLGMILAMSTDGKRVWLAVYPVGHKPRQIER